MNMWCFSVACDVAAQLQSAPCPHTCSRPETRDATFLKLTCEISMIVTKVIYIPLSLGWLGDGGVIWIEHLSGGGGSIFLSVRKCSGGQVCEQHFERFCIDSVGYVSNVYKVLVNAYLLHEFWWDQGKHVKHFVIGALCSGCLEN